MQNLPVSAHITVVSASPGAPAQGPALAPDAASPAGQGDFSNVLAKQLAAKVDALSRKPADVPLPVETQPDAAAEPETDPSGNLAVVAFVPLDTPLQPAVPTDAKDASRSRAAGAIELSRVFAPTADAVAADRADLPETELPAETPAADLAASEPTLPGKVPARAGVEALTQSVESTVKLTPQPQVMESQEVVPGWQPHAVAPQKSDAAPVAAAQAAQAAPVSVEARVGSAGWGAELGQKVVWLANQQQQIAHINVTPPQLGPIEIRLNLAHDQASATFVSPHAAVRDAIEAALPRLREMLAESGLTLGNVDVSAHSFGHARQEQGQHANSSRTFVPESAAGVAGGPGLPGSLPGATRSGAGLVDIFA